MVNASYIYSSEKRYVQDLFGPLEKVPVIVTFEDDIIRPTPDENNEPLVLYLLSEKKKKKEKEG